MTPTATQAARRPAPRQVLPFPTRPPAEPQALAAFPGDRAVRRWLFATAFAVVAAISVGGITRLTDSGLSITEWAPVSGIVPPLSDADWNAAFGQYQAIPQARTVHRGITLEAFKRLYWWEWFHRLVARGVGLVIVIPFFVLLLRRQVRPSLHLQLANIPLLTALQGAMGWYMVQSGLTERTDVSPYRLVAHLALALVILGIATWTATALRERDPGPEPSELPFAWASVLLALLAFFTLLSGGFVAGHNAGEIYNTFPLMGGALVPAGYSSLDGWRNLFENPIAVQFNHRILAIATAVAVLAVWSAAERTADFGTRRRLRIAAAAVMCQLALGIATLLLMVPVPLAILHQLGGVAVFVSLVAAAAGTRPAITRTIPPSP